MLLSYLLTGYYTVVGLFCLNLHIYYPDPKTLFMTQGCVFLLAGFGHVVYISNLCASHIDYVRYIEWSFGSPLMLYMLCRSAELEIIETLSLIVLTFSYCVCGVLAALTIIFPIKIFLCLLGSLYCVFVNARLFVLVKDSDNPYIHSSLITTSIIYPMFVCSWCLGPDIFGIIHKGQEFWIESSLSLMLKTSCFIYLLRHLSPLEMAHRAITITGLVCSHV